MRAPRTLVTYIVREVLLYTLLGLVTIILVLVTRNLIRALEDLVDAGFTAADLLLVVRLLGTMLVIYALPVSFLFGVLLAIGRMAADVEITAMRACGIGLRTFTVPVLVFGLIFSAFTWRLTQESEPAARREMQAAMKSMLARGGVIEPGKFRRFGGNRLFYVEGRDANGKLRGVVISDRSNPDRPFLVFAKTGTIELDEERGELVLGLQDGDIHVEGERGQDRYQRIAFERFDYAVDVASLLGVGRKRKAKEMSMADLTDAVKRIERGDTRGLREKPLEYAFNWYQRMATPFAPALFGLVAVPVAIRRTRGARSLGMIWCAALASGYYVLQTMCEMFALDGRLPVALAPWIPNLLFLVLGIALLMRARRAGM